MHKAFQNHGWLIRVIVVGVLLASMVQFPTMVHGAANLFVETNWRVDDPYVYDGDNYFVGIAPNQFISGPDPYGAGWIALYFSADQATAKFSQIGVIEQNSSFHFFVYSEAGVNCMNAAVPQGDGKTCNTLPGYHAGYLSLDFFQMIRLSDGYWYCYVYYPDGNGGYTQEALARLNVTIPYIYRTFIDTESSNNSSNPDAPAAFIFSHPKYVPYGQSSATDWEGSTLVCPTAFPIFDPGSPTDCLYTVAMPSRTICPEYNGIINFQGDPRNWFGRVEGYTSGIVCAAQFYTGFTVAR